jgi:NitT/TauT family transport system ATP-binding protein
VFRLEYIVQIKNIGMNYQSPNGEVPAITDISMNISKGEFICIVGPSGCGKSTLLSIIAGLLKPSLGSILINGGEHWESSRQVGYMLQKDYLFEWRTILQNVLLGLEIRKALTRENKEYVYELLGTYGLYEFKDKYPSQLSGGMRQRAALIRTLVLRPEILLLDEAFSALDYQTRLAVTDDIYSIIKKENKTAIMVTHDIAESISMADRIFVLTKRPAAVKSQHSILLTCDVRTPFNSREAPEFRHYFNTIWKELDVHV